ncbi:hypothetical protein ACFUAB_30740, partial [Streptomyces cinereoruber]|uniref:hypothetical protein n=1 Tax=Streptomyces cinereoruber TaxID=67260 RepID=UPI0036402257
SAHGDAELVGEGDGSYELRMRGSYGYSPGSMGRPRPPGPAPDLLGLPRLLRADIGLPGPAPAPMGRPRLLRTGPGSPGPLPTP